MAKEKTFDAVTIIGLLVAAGLLLIGMNMSRRQPPPPPPAPAGPVPQAQVSTAQPGGGTVPAGEPAAAKGAEKASESAAEAEKDTEPAVDVTVKGGLLDLTFTARGASLKDAVLAQEVANPGESDPAKRQRGLEILAEIQSGVLSFGLPRFETGPEESAKQSEWQAYDQAAGKLRSPDHRVWELKENSNGFGGDGNWKLVYAVTLQGKYTLTKTFTVNRGSHLLRCDLTVTNHTPEAVSYSYALNGPAGILLDGPKHDPRGGAYVNLIAELAGRDAAQSGQGDVGIDVKQADAATAEKGVDEKTTQSKAENIWGAVKNRFYTAILISLDPKQLISLRAIPVKHQFAGVDAHAGDLRYADANIGVQGARRKSDKLAANQTSAPERYALYLGPSQEAQLTAAQTELNMAQPLHLDLAIHYCDIFGWRWPNVDWVARQFVWLFKGLHSVFGNYGLAVILLTLTIKLALHPLQRKTMISMSKMAKLQPELKKLQEKYKGQTSAEARQKMYLEQQELMRKGGASPVAGCLPMFLQIPVFSALYGIFNRAFEIRGANFLWITDLSQQDNLAALPFWPHVLNLLPLIYMAVTMMQTKINPAPKSDDPQQEMNRKMMTYMPIMFSLLFYRMPSGLVLYFAAQAVFGMAETWYIKNRIMKDEPTANASKPSGNRPPPAVVKR